MNQYFLSIIVLAAMLASGCTANQLGTGPAVAGGKYSLDEHVRYYEEIRAHAVLASRGNECGAQ